MAKPHVLDINTFALYRLDEAFLDAKDATSSHRNLTGSGGGVPVPSLIRDAGRARFFDGTHNIKGADNATDWAGLFSGECTVELWARLGDNFSGNARFFEFYAPGATGGSNRFWFGLLASPWRMTVVWEHGTHAQVSDIGPTLLKDPTLRSAHYAFHKYVSLGSTYVDLFFNGAKIHTSSALVNYDGGSLGAMYLGGSITELLTGRMDDVRFSSLSRSDIEILASYTRGSTEPPIVVEG